MTLLETLKYMKNMKEIFQNITRVLSILLTTAATSASVNALLLVQIHRDILLKHGKTIDMQASKYPRRMLLINPLSEN